MSTTQSAPVLLRKIGGRFDACRRTRSFATAGAGGVSDFALLSAATPLLAFVAVALVAVLALLAGVFGLEPLATGALLATAPVAATQADVKKIADELQSSFKAFTEKHDEMLKAGERADALLKAEVEKLNAEVGKQQQELSAAVKQLSRPPLTGEPSKADAKAQARIREFVALTRGVKDMQGIEITNEVLDEVKAYGHAFRQYLRTGDVQAAMSVGSQPDGGYLVKPDTSGRIVELVYEMSPLRQLASVETIGTDTLEGGTDLGEAGAGWVGETEERTETGTPKIGEWKIPVQEVYAQPETTQKVLDDAMRDVEGWLAAKVANKFARMEMQAGISGDGLKRWKGILTYVTNAKPTAANWKRIELVKSGANGGFPATAGADRLIDLVHTLKTAYRQGAVFFGNTLTIAALRKIKNENGDYVFQPDMLGGFAGRVLGFSVVEFPDMPDLATGSDSLGFGNLREGYQIVDRLGIRVLRDPLTKKGWVKFYSTKRSGGDVVNFEAIKVMRFET